MTYLSTVLADSPTHFWRLADPGGSMAIDIAPAHQPLVAAGLNRPPFGYTGPNKDGGSACFVHGGTPDTNANTADPIAYAGAMSMECWMWGFADNPHGTFQTILGWDGTTAGYSALAYASTGIIGMTYNGTACNSAAGVAAIRTWHHIVGTYDGTNAKIYVDAILQNTVAIAQANKNLVFIISRDIAAAHVFEGFLSEVAIYPMALSAAQVTAHYVAADNYTISPSLVSPGSVSGTTGSPTYSTADITAILEAVTRTLPTLP